MLVLFFFTDPLRLFFRHSQGACRSLIGNDHNPRLAKLVFLLQEEIDPLGNGGIPRHGLLLPFLC